MQILQLLASSSSAQLSAVRREGDLLEPPGDVWVQLMFATGPSPSGLAEEYSVESENWDRDLKLDNQLSMKLDE